MLLQPLAATPVTVYVVVVVGFAVGLAQLVQDNPVAGDHVYVLAPVAASVVLLPMHMVLLGPALTVGTGFTATVIWSVLLHPPEVPVTVYIVVVAGDATGLSQLVQDSPVAGDHE